MNTIDHGILNEFAQLLCGIGYSSLDPATIDKAKLAVVNCAGGSLPGCRSKLAATETKLWLSQGSSGSCTVFGTGGKFSALAAASVNAAMGEIYLSEDCHPPTLSHPGMIVIPAALAAAQERGASGKELIAAVTAGYECMARIGRILIVRDFAKNGLRPASVLAVLGAAAAAAKLLQLDEEAMAAALSIACNTAAGVMEFVNSGTEDICIQNCFAAKCGLMSAYLAAEGVQGAYTALEGSFGLGRAFTGRELPWDELCRPSESFAINETFVKAFPGCGHVQSTAQAAMELVGRESFSPDDVAGIEIGVCTPSAVWPGVDNPGPFGGTISAMMSHQYMAASAIVYGSISAGTIDRFAEQAVSDLAAKGRVYVDPDMDSAAPGKAGTVLTVELKDGRKLHSTQQGRPLEKEGILLRLRENASGILKDGAAERFISLAESLETLANIHELMSLLEP